MGKALTTGGDSLGLLAISFGIKLGNKPLQLFSRVHYFGIFGEISLGKDLGTDIL